MGGTNSTEQVREVLETRITNVLQQTIMTKATTVEQTASNQQLMDQITITQPDPRLCPNGTGNLMLSQTRSVGMGVALSLQMVSASELSDVVRKEVEDSANNEIDKEKKGSLAFNDSTNLSQRFTVSETTMRNVQNTIQAKLDTYIKQEDEGGQIVKRVTIIQPCGDVVLSQESVANMTASDLASATVDTLMKSDEAKRFVTASVGKEKAKATDTLVAAVDSVTGMVKSIAGAWTVALLIIPLLIVGVVLLLLFRGRSSSNEGSDGGGGGGGGDEGYYPPAEGGGGSLRGGGGGDAAG